MSSIILSICAYPDTEFPVVIEMKHIRNIVIYGTPGHFYITDTISFYTIQELVDYFNLYSFHIPDGTEILLKRARLLAPWEFKHSQVKVGKKLGQGAFGEVYRGTLMKKKEKLDVAIKTLKNVSEISKAKINEMMGEARLMRMLNHPNIVRIRGIAFLEKPFYLVLDYIDGGDLRVYLDKDGASIDIDERNTMASAAAWGLEYLHKEGIIHRDIAARNCLYDSNKMIKISDFGLSTRGPRFTLTVPQKLPIRWMAPESIKSYTFTYATDVYSYGLLLYEIYTNGYPYGTNPQNEVRELKLKNVIPSFEEAKCDQEVTEFITTKILTATEETRAKMSDISKFFTAKFGYKLEFLDEDDEKQPTSMSRPPDAPSDNNKEPHTKSNSVHSGSQTLSKRNSRPRSGSKEKSQGRRDAQKEGLKEAPTQAQHAAGQGNAGQFVEMHSTRKKQQQQQQHHAQVVVHEQETPAAVSMKGRKSMFKGADAFSLASASHFSMNQFSTAPSRADQSRRTRNSAKSKAHQPPQPNRGMSYKAPKAQKKAKS